MENDNKIPNHYSSLVKSDTFSSYGKTGFMTTLKGFMVNRHFRAIVSLRMCQHSYKQPKLLKIFMYPLARLIHKITTNQASIDLP